MQKPYIISVVGPTAVGKSRLSIVLAEKFNGEIINGDAIQMYKELRIGAGKITEDEKRGIPHYGLDVFSPQEVISVARFQQLFTEYRNRIEKMKKLPILVGGTGLYVQSVLEQFPLAHLPTCEKVREDIHHKYPTNQELYTYVTQIDAESATKIPLQNRQRLLRVAEVYALTGKRFSSLSTTYKDDVQFIPILIGLTGDRKILYDRIHTRIDEMIKFGQFEEVELLLEKGYRESPAMKAIGYKELIPYFENLSTKEEVIQVWKQHTRNFAKRQLTWFRNRMNVEWFDISMDEKKLNENVIRYIDNQMMKKH